MDNTAQLVLQDGTIFQGISIGVKGVAVGELLFNTSSVGYQEALTDPSYTGQLIVFTTPHIGNTGCHSADEESSQFRAAGLILREKPTLPSHWQSQESLQDYLEKNHVVGIAEIDTRCLTRLLIQRGHLTACIVSEGYDIQQAQALAAAFDEVRHPGLLGKVTTALPYLYTKHLAADKKPHIVVYDFGVKQNILRLLEMQEVKITVVPAAMPVHKIQALEPDGIVLSNGPGDPLAYTPIIDIVKKLILTSIPIMGICLGHQLLGLAFGARIQKLKFGHHGINHPVKELRTGRVFITTQNHNFALADEGLPDELEVTYRSLFDGSIQGIQHKHQFICGVQGHPEGCPGPTELSFLLESFLKAAAQYQLEKMELPECLSTPA